MTELTEPELLDLFDQEVHDGLRRLVNDPETDALVIFENIQLDSSNLGARSAVAVGPTRTYKTIEECEGRHLHDLPSQRQYARFFYRKPPSVREGNTASGR